MQLTKNEISKLKKGDKINVRYKPILPQVIIDRQYSHPGMNPLLKPTERSIPAKVVSNGKKGIKIQPEALKLITIDHEDFREDGSKGIDSSMYLCLERN